ncbi:deoxyribodipyrimidine photo-lyase, partial [uncultured Erythrobacter sp.]|uniref:deoxyribodipyrimidine photo-lyase n=1 Tax=uncultured Erythrobacter sp. TaxID=263913 RepID=UPI00344D0392
MRACVRHVVRQAHHERGRTISQAQIVWLRRDLRMADQPALFAAAELGPVVPVYVLDDECAGSHAYGGASRWWLHHSLDSLARDLGKHNVRLILRRGDAVEQLTALSKELGGAPIHAVRHYEPWWRKAQGKLKEQAVLHLYDGNYLLPPGAVRTGSGTPYKIYTPFSKALKEQLPPRDQLHAPESFTLPDAWPESDSLDDWGLLP